MPRRTSKRLKLSPKSVVLLAAHHQKVEGILAAGDVPAVPVQIEEKPIDGFDISDIWLPDGPCFLVYSFLCNGSINASRYADGISSLVHNYSLISTDFHKSIQRYLQSAPMTIRCRFAHNLNQRIQMICEKQVNLSEFHYDLVKEDDDSTSTTNAHGDAHDHDASSDSKLEDYVKILSSCKISNLHTLGLNLPGYRADDYQTYDSKKSIDFQKYIAQELASSCKPTKIKICTHDNELHVPMLTKFSSSLEELEISITRNKNQVGSVGLRKLISALKGLKKLKKLKIINNKKFGSFNVNVISKSLEEIDLVGCDNEFFLGKVNCPSLQTIRCRYHHKKYVHYPNERAELLNGIDPYDLLNSNDDLEDSISDRLEEEGDDNNNKWLEIPAEVYGFTVSSSCKIVILVTCGCCLMD
jgi:hypothetical protein